VDPVVYKIDILIEPMIINRTYVQECQKTAAGGKTRGRGQKELAPKNIKSAKANKVDIYEKENKERQYAMAHAKVRALCLGRKRSSSINVIHNTSL
jgi:hypothetical protein